MRPRTIARVILIFLLVGLAVAAPRRGDATLVTTLYGDDDGFGVGATSGTLNENSSNAEVGEAAGTDVRLIGLGFIAPPFAPTGSFDPFAIPPGETIVAAQLTMRTGGFDSGPSPVDEPEFPSQILLDGLLIDPGFLAGFSSDPGILEQGMIETRTVALAASFFGILADGSVSLDGTHISEDSGSGSFQIDFLRLDITTAAVPEPSALVLVGSGLIGVAVVGRRWMKKR